MNQGTESILSRVCVCECNVDAIVTGVLKLLALTILPELQIRVLTS